MDSMTLIWQRIEAWLANHAPLFLDRLNPGASEEELLQTEAKLAVTLPEDFKASYQIHNGGVSLFVGMSASFFSLTDVVGDWSVSQDLKENQSGWAESQPGFLTDPGRKHPPIQPVWWHPKWIPFAADGAGNTWCVDLDPAPGGQVGQVIDWDHEDGPTRVLFPSFQALLSQLADDLEAGKYLFFSNRIEERLTKGKEARDQARYYDHEQPSPGKQLLEQALRPEWLGRSVSEDEKITLFQQVMAKYMQVLQLETATSSDRFRAYHNLILLYRSEVLRIARARATGQPLHQAAVRQVEETYRIEAERLLAAFAREAKQMPAEHWVYDDLEQAIGEVFCARRVLDLANQWIARGDLESAIWNLSLASGQNQTWFTAEEQFEIYALLIDVFLRQQQIEQAKLIFAQFAAAAQKFPPENPVHDIVRDFATRLQHMSDEQ